MYTVGITLVDETPALEGENDLSSQKQQQQQLAEGLKFAYDAPDKTSTDQSEQVRNWECYIQKYCGRRLPCTSWCTVKPLYSGHPWGSLFRSLAGYIYYTKLELAQLLLQYRNFLNLVSAVKVVISSV